MTRKKVKLAYIEDLSSRKATFRKRKAGLMKKMYEISTLCGVDACAIIYSPFNNEPQVWPSNEGVQDVLSKFEELCEIDQSKQKLNQDSFLRQRIRKTDEQLKKQIRLNREKELSQIMYRLLSGEILHNLSIDDVNDLQTKMVRFRKDITMRIHSLEEAEGHPINGN
ncbi:Transcription factor, MADS-box [Dillenia turbinata]|uniref:Transcription factor, MADS-box n=1 Tax=Dillenia turbinata TaxID=194707 RepID=A0AAN8UUY8_9MAGN